MPPYLVEDRHRVGIGRHLGPRRCDSAGRFGSYAPGDNCLIRRDVVGGDVLHGDLLLASASVVIEPFSQHHYCPRCLVCQLQIFNPAGVQNLITAMQCRCLMEPTALRIVSGLLAHLGQTSGCAMKWILVVLIGGVTPVQTDVQFDKLSDCLSAEEQLRNTYAGAYEAWDRSAAINIERRRDYRKSREFQERRLATGTCVPRAGTDQPAAVTRTGEQPTGTTSPQPPPH
jgi:hypothetical protein